MSSCPNNKQWYVCSAGGFRGCCSSDPCSTGICPDDAGGNSSKSSNTSSNSSSRASSGTTSTTSTITSTRTPMTTSDSNPKPKFKPVETRTPPRQGTLTTPISDSVPKSTSTDIPAASNSKPNGALIGGAAAGAAALLVLLALLLWLCYRSRKKQGRTFYLILWRGNVHTKRGDKTSKSGSSSKAGKSPMTKRGHSFDTVPRSSFSTVGISPIHPNSTQFPLPNQSTQPPLSPNSQIKAASSLTLLADAATSATTSSSSTNIIAAAGAGATTTRHTPTLPPIPDREPTPELPDTGFYRQRAELPEQSSRELINVHRRQHRRASSLLATNSPSSSSNNRSSTTALPIITADGALLTANFERTGVDDSFPESGASGQSHAMSFMRFEQEVEETLPAYRDSWRGRFEGEEKEGTL